MCHGYGNGLCFGGIPQGAAGQYDPFLLDMGCLFLVLRVFGVYKVKACG